MNENQTIPKESLYPHGEQSTDRMQISDLGIIESDASNGAETGINITPAPPAPAAPQMQTPPPAPRAPATTVPQAPIANFETKKTPSSNSVTYFEDGSNGNGIEVDLVSFREKGEETRFLSFVIKNIVENEEYNLQTTMDTEERFMQFKRFVANLNWND